MITIFSPISRLHPELEQSLLEKFGVCTGAHEDNQSGLSAVIKFVGQKKIATNMAFPVSVPVAAQRVIEPFRPKWTPISDQQKHCFLEPVHVVPAGP